MWNRIDNHGWKGRGAGTAGSSGDGEKRVRRAEKGETTEVKGHMRHSIETQCGRSFLKYINKGRLSK